MFALWPDLRPTRALYIDFEGSGSGDERIMSIYWPQLAGSDRFRMLWRGSATSDLSSDSLESTLRDLSCNPSRLEWVVVFSAGQPVPEEQTRFEAVFGNDWFPKAEWVNLHFAMRKSTITRSVRSTAWAKHVKDKKRIRYGLENLEYQFGYVRPRELRSHEYRHKDGTVGLMKVLETEQDAFNSGKGIGEFETLVDYCQYDVESMFRIARWCEKNQ